MMTLNKAAKWFMDRDAEAPLAEIEEEARRQSRTSMGPETGQGAVWCRDVEGEATMAGRIAGTWVTEQWKMGRGGGEVDVLVPTGGLQEQFRRGLEAGLEGWAGIVVEEVRNRIRVESKAHGRLQFDIRGARAGKAGYGRRSTLQAAFLCAAAERHRGYGDAIAGVIGSMSGYGNIMWFFASPPRLWDSVQSSSTPISAATEPYFWRMIEGGTMYVKRVV